MDWKQKVIFLLVHNLNRTGRLFDKTKSASNFKNVIC